MKEDQNEMMVCFTATLKELFSIQDKKLTKIENTLDSLRSNIHATPCQTLIKHIESHQQDKNYQTEVTLIRKKFIYNTLSVILASTILALLGAIYYAITHGY